MFNGSQSFVQPASNILELGKVPDFVRDLRNSDGQPNELNNWIDDVESIMNLCERCRVGETSLMYELIQKTIRRKICGQAADVLNSNNITSKWSEIKETLLLYYCDKRDLKTLDFELTTVKRGKSEPLNSYYGRVNELLASLVTQVQTQDSYKNNASIHIDFF